MDRAEVNFEEALHGIHHFLSAEDAAALALAVGDCLTDCFALIEVMGTVRFVQHAVVPVPQAVVPCIGAGVHVQSLVQ